MRLLLKRRYTPRHTLGRLYLGSRLLCRMREAPKSCYAPERHCLPEGVYELEPVHDEQKGWSIRVGAEGWIRCLGPERQPGLEEMAPFTNISNGKRPGFTRLAFQKLLDELGMLWEQGEVLELQVIGIGIPYRLESCPIPRYS